MKATQVKKELRKYSNPEKSILLGRFFKTGKGQYGEGDKFLGIMVPSQRKIAKIYKDLGLKEVQKLLDSPYHEDRLIGLLILTYQYSKSNPEQQKQIFDFYIANTSRINNWDLVDVTAPKIIGYYLRDNKRQILYKFAKSKSLWERRIAIISCFAFIDQGDFVDALAIATILLSDKEDLIHKAVGWVLREVGKKNTKILRAFLEKNVSKMPRTMLRYAIEKLPETERKNWLRTNK